MCETKTCTKCGEVKPVGEFHKDKLRGHAAACKVCDHARAAAYRAQHKEQIKEKNARDHKRRGVEDGRERSRAWRRINPERAKRLRNLWAAANPEKVREGKRLSAQRGAVTLSDSFVKKRLSLGGGVQIPKTLIELKRAHIQLYRAIYDHKPKDDSNATTT